VARRRRQPDGGAVLLQWRVGGHATRELDGVDGHVEAEPDSGRALDGHAIAQSGRHLDSAANRRDVHHGARGTLDAAVEVEALSEGLRHGAEGQCDAENEAHAGTARREGISHTPVYAAGTRRIRYDSFESITTPTETPLADASHQYQEALMGDRTPGPICTARVGDHWIDGGTNCRTRVKRPGPVSLADAWPEGSNPAKDRFDADHVYSLAPEAARKRDIDLQIIGDDY